MPTRQGSFHLFRLFGIDVYLHWAWFLAAVYFIYYAKGYASPIWSVLECLALFAIVLTHEFGHEVDRVGVQWDIGRQRRVPEARG